MTKKMFYQDYRFFIKAEDVHEAADIIIEKLPETDDELYMYTAINVIDEFKKDPMRWNPQSPTGTTNSEAKEQ